MIIHPAAPTDAQALTEIALASKRFWGYSTETMELWTEALTIRSSAIEANSTFVAEDETGVLGFCMLWTDGMKWELEHMWVAPRAIRRGVGKALLARAFDAMRATQGGGTLRIEADPNAESFYLACGARRIGSVAAPIPERLDRYRPILEITVA